MVTVIGRKSKKNGSSTSSGGVTLSETKKSIKANINLSLDLSFLLLPTSEMQ